MERPQGFKNTHTNTPNFLLTIYTIPRSSHVVLSGLVNENCIVIDEKQIECRWSCRYESVHLLLKQDRFLAALEVTLNLQLLSLHKLGTLDGELLVGEGLDLGGLLTSLLEDERHHVVDLLVHSLIVHVVSLRTSSIRWQMPFLMR